VFLLAYRANKKHGGDSVRKSTSYVTVTASAISKTELFRDCGGMISERLVS